MEEPTKKLGPEEIEELIRSSIKNSINDLVTPKNELIILQDATGSRVELHSFIEPLGSMIASAHDSLNKLKGINNGKTNMPGVS